MFYALSKTLDLLFSPLSWSLGLALACVWAALRGRVRGAQALGIAAWLVLFVPATGWVAFGLFGYTEQFEGKRIQPDVSYDAVILLGGFLWRGPDGAIELAESADRALRAWELLAAGRARQVVIAGGGTASWGREADVVAELLARLGIDRRRMLLDRESRNTRESALEVRAIVERAKLKRLVMVTSAFHMQRSLECMRAVGLNPDALATDHRESEFPSWLDRVLPRASHLALSERALRELAGRLVYRARGFAR